MLSITPLTKVSPGRANAVVRGDCFSLGNSAFEILWTLQDGQWFLTECVNKITGERSDAFAFSPLFEITLEGGRVLGPRDFTTTAETRTRQLEPAVGSARYSHGLPGVCVECSFRCAAPAVGIVWRASLRDDSHYVTLSVDISGGEGGGAVISSTSLLDFREGALAPLGVVDGSPLVSNAFFAGMESPSAVTVSSNGRTRSVVPGRIVLPPSGSISYSAAIGAVVPSQLRRSYQCYVERERAHPYRQHLHWNSWGDVSWHIGETRLMTSDNTLESMRGLAEGLILPHQVKLDAFVMDDGWDDHDSLWEFDRRRFPQGLQPQFDAAQSWGISLGVWLSPFGGYGQPKAARVANGVKHGYESNSHGLTLAGPNYYRAFRERCERMLRDYRVNYFKFDGIGLGLEGATGAGPECFADLEAIRKLIADLRNCHPELFINLTVGSWPSPYWLWSADSIWRTGTDAALQGEGNAHEKYITYRDARTFEHIVQKAPLFPINSVMLHGVSWATHDIYGHPEFNSEGFRHDVHAFFGTGTGIQELYLTPNKLSAADWAVLADAAKWSRANAPILGDSRWIGGNPAENSVYGWAAWGGRKGIITLRNPSSKAGSYDMLPTRDFELPDGAPCRLHARSKWGSTVFGDREQLASDAVYRVELKPHEVLTIEMTGDPADML